MMGAPIPVALFAYDRPGHLGRALDALRADGVPLIYAFIDGPAEPSREENVAAVRARLRAVDWCRLELRERRQNLGLGRSIRTGVAEVLERHDALLVVEDDLVCVPGTYRYLTAALERYREREEVMSVTAWTHPRVTPGDVGDRPYFDGRAECWLWGTWRRGWAGMERDAESLMAACVARGIEPWRYGNDLPAMAETERARNIWAVRFLYLHILRGGLCLRPPWSMVEHVGFDAAATNAAGEDRWANPPLGPAPPIPDPWPEPAEHPRCAALWRAACGGAPGGGALGRLRRWVRRMAS